MSPPCLFLVAPAPPQFEVLGTSGFVEGAGAAGAGLPPGLLAPAEGATVLPGGNDFDGSSVSLWHPASKGVAQAAATQSATARFIFLVKGFSFSLNGGNEH